MVDRYIELSSRLADIEENAKAIVALNPEQALQWRGVVMLAGAEMKACEQKIQQMLDNPAHSAPVPAQNAPVPAQNAPVPVPATPVQQNAPAAAIQNTPVPIPDTPVRAAADAPVVANAPAGEHAADPKLIPIGDAFANDAAKAQAQTQVQAQMQVQAQTQAQPQAKPDTDMQCDGVGPYIAKALKEFFDTACRNHMANPPVDLAINYGMIRLAARDSFVEISSDGGISIYNGDGANFQISGGADTDSAAVVAYETTRVTLTTGQYDLQIVTDVPKSIRFTEAGQTVFRYNF